jgi:hypothetical protein
VSLLIFLSSSARLYSVQVVKELTEFNPANVKPIKTEPVYFERVRSSSISTAKVRRMQQRRKVIITISVMGRVTHKTNSPLSSVLYWQMTTARRARAEEANDQVEEVRDFELPSTYTMEVSGWSVVVSARKKKNATFRSVIPVLFPICALPCRPKMHAKQHRKRCQPGQKPRFAAWSRSRPPLQRVPTDLAFGSLVQRTGTYPVSPQIFHTIFPLFNHFCKADLKFRFTFVFSLPVRGNRAATGNAFGILTLLVQQPRQG